MSLKGVQPLVPGLLKPPQPLLGPAHRFQAEFALLLSTHPLHSHDAGIAENVEVPSRRLTSDTESLDETTQRQTPPGRQAPDNLGAGRFSQSCKDLCHAASKASNFASSSVQPSSLFPNASA